MKLYLLSIRYSEKGDLQPIHEAFGAFFAESLEDAKKKVVNDLYESEDFWEFVAIELEGLPEGYNFKYCWLREQNTGICHLMKTDLPEYGIVWRTDG